ncbi:hypothetical protein ASG22_13990 [Chryseobacterium sp. Leaf405]|uniref:hypothetical protein n=1 Tax=Chryseobacterium sp. Leaf405 TaxID=1736367 RepID=UPI0007013B77|nr:hypothetical protein [Chryseobacterium sp. Leaf405]KQT22857.1 hypothetical protein ASG22_13990 [Chryseobacterium sp. Leaf405]
MNNLNEPKEIVPKLSENYLSGPIGNKLVEIIEEHPLTKFIDELMAKSFIKHAKDGMFPILLKNNVNFNVDGIYEMEYSLLQDICTKMDEIGADNLVFTFVEVDQDNEFLEMNTVGNGNILYAVASLVKGNKIVENEYNYLVINVKKGLTLDNLNITYADKKKLRDSYIKYSHKILKDYFSINGKNTQFIYYHIDDIKKTLVDENGRCDTFKVYLCEISDVEKVISEYDSSLTIRPEVYREHFQFRERQMTLVFNSEDRYYDMGGLRP